VLRIARNTATKIGLKEEDITEEDVVLDENYHEGIYGVPGEGTIKAMEYAASKDAFITDPVYEGKSFAGLIDLAKKGEFAGKTVLYAHLGGQPALNAYSDIGRAK
jgi:1-aminocyclopropane-1-carboxylate deaminase